MTTSALRTATARSVSGVLATARRGHPGLFWFAAAMGVVVVVAAVGVVADDRMLLGAPIWLKPLKFALSFGFYALALAWMLSLLTRGRRTGRVIGWALAAASAIEVGLVVVQVVRGRRSHYNEETPLDASIFSWMGMTVALIWLATAVVGVLLLRRRLDDPGMRWAIRLGLGLSLIGMALGMLMVDGSAHSVGVPDGGPGVPLFGWTTVGGDLRVGHFVGLHALQVLPLFAAGLAALDVLPAVRGRLVLVASAGYFGLITLLTWQALRGQPVFAPDPTTLAALGLLVVAVAGGAWAAVRRPVAA